MARRKRPLNDMELEFVKQYLSDMDPKAAAARAGYKQPHKLGPRLMARERIRDAIEEANHERIRATGLDANWVLKELHGLYNQAGGDVKKVWDAAGKKQATDDDGNLIFQPDLKLQHDILKTLMTHVEVDALAASKTNTHHGLDEQLTQALLEGRRRAAMGSREERVEERKDGLEMIDITPAEELL